MTFSVSFVLCRSAIVSAPITVTLVQFTSPSPTTVFFLSDVNLLSLGISFLNLSVD